MKEREGSLGRKSLELQCNSKKVKARLMRSPLSLDHKNGPALESVLH